MKPMIRTVITAMTLSIITIGAQASSINELSNDRPQALMSHNAEYTRHPEHKTKPEHGYQHEHEHEHESEHEHEHESEHEHEHKHERASEKSHR